MPINWNEAYSSGRDYRVMNELLLNKILDSINITEGQILDIGSGTGDLATKLAKRNFKVVGTDISSVAIEKAIERAKEQKVEDSVEFHVLDVAKLSENETISSQQFDLIFCKLVYAFIDDKNQLLEWIKNHLKSSGKLILITPVSHPKYDYSLRLKNISVDYSLAIETFNKFFSSVVNIDTEYFEELGDERTFVLGV